MKHFINTIFMSIALLAASSASAFVSVQNNVSVEATTGGNSGGTGNEGNAESSVFVETLVNGEVVEHIEENISSKDEVPESVNRTSEYKSEDGSVEVKTEINLEVSEEETAEQSQVNLEEKTNLELREGDSEDISEGNSEAIEKVFAGALLYGSFTTFFLELFIHAINFILT